MTFIKRTIFLLLISVTGLSQNSQIETLLDQMMKIPVSYDYKDSIRKVALEGIRLAAQENDSISLASFKTNLGVSYYLEGDYNQTLDYYYEALNYLNTRRNRYKYALLLQNISVIHELIGNLDLAIIYVDSALSFLNSPQDDKLISACYINKGATYTNQENYGLAKASFIKALDLKMSLGDSLGMGRCYVNLSAVFIDLHEYENAIQTATKALDIFSDLKLSVFNLSCYINILKSYAELGKPNEKVASLLIAEIDRTPKEEKSIAYDVLSLHFEKKGDFQKALAYKKKFQEMEDSLSKLNDAAIYKSIEEKYTDNETQNNREKSLGWLRLSLFVILAIIFIGLFVFYFKRNSSRAIKKDSVESSMRIDHHPNLSKRELEVVQLIIEGYSSKMIAEKLFVSINTVNTHRKKIYKKLQVSNTAELIASVNKSKE